MAGLVPEILPFAIGFAVSPAPVVAVILMLGSRHGIVNALAFISGWIVALLIASIALGLAIGTPGSEGGGVDSRFLFAAELAMGALLLLLLMGFALRRPRGMVSFATRFLSGVDELHPFHAVLTGVALFPILLKNLALMVAGLSEILRADVSFADGLGAWMVFMVVAVLPLLVPVAVYLARPGRSAPILTRWKDWLIVNNRAILMVIFAVLGGVLVVSGLGGLLRD